MWLFKKVIGNGNSSYIQELSEDSSDDSDFDYSVEHQDKKSQDNTTTNVVLDSTKRSITDAEANIITEPGVSNAEMITTDAAIRTFPKPELTLCLDQVLEIEKKLDNYEMVSMVYLLYDDARYALQELTLFLQGAGKSLLYTWANFEANKSMPWQNKLIEALCVIKNYQILRTLGYDKHDTILHYLPHLPNAVTSLDIVKKALYLICEKLNMEKTEIFLRAVSNHIKERGMVFTDGSNPEYLELYFLNWESIGYISTTDANNIKTVLKSMGEELLCSILESVTAVSRDKTEERQEISTQRKLCTSTDTHQRSPPSRDDSGDYRLQPGSSFQENIVSAQPKADDYQYEIDPENPGVLLIINQQEFYTEIDESFKHLLPNEIECNKLESRIGTEKDKHALIRTFERFGFNIIVENDLVHEEVIAKIKEVVKAIRKESSLFVCIMSHGDKGVIYGSNSCKVKVSKIQDIMCRTNKEHLKGKPKVLILQSCQGKQCQRINEASEDEDNPDNQLMATDGPNMSKSVPPTADLFTFWATVPGYAAIRNKRTGSWFIQALCSKMIELGNKYHFEDICTRIINDVTERRWTVENCEENTMTPKKESTLRKSFYLPPMKS